MLKVYKDFSSWKDKVFDPDKCSPKNDLLLSDFPQILE